MAQKTSRFTMHFTGANRINGTVCCRGNHQIQFSYEIPSETRRESFLESIGEIPDMQELVENLSVTKNQTYRCLKL
jgi:hypothetical protein